MSTLTSTVCSIAIRALAGDHKHMVDSKKRTYKSAASSPQEKRFYEFLALCELDKPGFEKETSYSPQRVGQWFRRKPTKVPEEAMAAIHEVAARRHITGLTLDWFNLGVGPGPSKKGHAGLNRKSVVALKVEQPPLDETRNFRVLFLKGYSREPTHFVDIPSSLLRDDPAFTSPTIRAFLNPSDAMRGEIEKGDMVFIDSTVSSVTVDGIYAYKLGGIANIRRIQVRGKGILRIQGTKTYEDSLELSGAELDDLEIGGRVVGSIGCRKF
ncbi:MAG: S24 family peptidase [Rhodanobacter sp.]